MGFYSVCRSFIVYTVTFFSLPLHEHIGGDSEQPVLSFENGQVSQNYPKFPAPNGPDSPDEDFICKYPELGNDWKSCFTPENRHCWLKSSDGHNFRDRSKDLELGIENVKDRPHAGDRFSWWAFGERPLWLDFSNPTIILIEERKEWPDDYVIVPAENRDGWVYLVITAPSLDRIGTNKTFSYIYLHGHDFALLAQGTNSSQINDPNNPVTLKFDNPPRRDVALIPAGVYLVVAFKADNPDSWLFHCHIAWHASSGLALQTMEREEDLRKMMTPEKLKQVNDCCKKWKDWYGDRKNHWNPVGIFQDDSGV
ncbi:laccase 2 [Fusarium sp. NRRL 25303]|nr:laccase 2 [Fusarium sp. NRRL 25303]